MTTASPAPDTARHAGGHGDPDEGTRRPSIGDTGNRVDDTATRFAMPPALTEPVLILVVRGMPAPQGSKRAYVNPHSGRAQLVESSSRVRPWRSAVRDAAVAAHNGRDPISVPVRVSMVFTFARPRSHYGTGRNSDRLKPGAPARPGTIPDLSKLIRSTEDAITDAGVWRDDALVVDITAAKVYAGSHPDALTVPGAVVRIWTEP